MDKEYPLKAPVLLNEFHAVNSFDCADEALNTYLKKFAYLNNQNASARTYVSVRKDRVVGYYTITPGSVTKKEAPQRVGKGLANHPIPVIILARLAVHKPEQSSGIGKGLLRDALLRIVTAADIIGGRAVLVHAKDNKAKSFYHIGISKAKFRFPAVFLRKQSAGDKIGTNSDVTPVLALRSKATGPEGKIVHERSECLSCEHFGFEPSPIDPFHLYLLLKDIKKTLEI